MSTIARELKRNGVEGAYRQHAAHQLAMSRRPRPRRRWLEADEHLRELVRGYLDKRWSPAQIAHERGEVHD